MNSYRKDVSSKNIKHSQSNTPDEKLTKISFEDNDNQDYLLPTNIKDNDSLKGWDSGNIIILNNKNNNQLIYTPKIIKANKRKFKMNKVTNTSPLTNFLDLKHYIEKL